jgi:hypothetical protein
MFSARRPELLYLPGKLFSCLLVARLKLERFIFVKEIPNKIVISTRTVEDRLCPFKQRASLSELARCRIENGQIRGTHRKPGIFRANCRLRDSQRLMQPGLRIAQPARPETDNPEQRVKRSQTISSIPRKREVFQCFPGCLFGERIFVLVILDIPQIVQQLGHHFRLRAGCILNGQSFRQQLFST